MELSGRRVLLTGATGGLGHAIARALHGRGADLVLTGRRADVLEPLAAEVGGRAVVADLADPAAIGPLVDAAGDVDVLVANAALPGSGPVLEYEPEQIDRALTVNLRAPDSATIPAPRMKPGKIVDTPTPVPWRSSRRPSANPRRPNFVAE